MTFTPRLDVLPEAQRAVWPALAGNPDSLFIDIGRVDTPQRTVDRVTLVASLLDLFGTKLKVLLERVAAWDYLDLAAILRSGVPLPVGYDAG